MNLNLIHNYIYTRQLELDLVELKKSAMYLKDYVKNNIVPDGTGYDSKGKGKVRQRQRQGRAKARQGKGKGKAKA
jgi:hypothetical protein